MRRRSDTHGGPMIARWALLGAVAGQLADGLTFALGLRSGIPISVEANPLARFLYGAFGLAGVLDFKLLVLGAIVVAVALAQSRAPRRADGRRWVLIGAFIVGLGGVLGTLANVAVLLPGLHVTA